MKIYNEDILSGRLLLRSQEPHSALVVSSVVYAELLQTRHLRNGRDATGECTAYYGLLQLFVGDKSYTKNNSWLIPADMAADLVQVTGSAN